MISEETIRDVVNMMLDNIIIEKELGIFCKDETITRERLKILEYFNRKSHDTENIYIINIIANNYKDKLLK